MLFGCASPTDPARDECTRWSDGVYESMQAHVGGGMSADEVISELASRRDRALAVRPEGCLDNWKIEASETALCEAWQEALYSQAADLPDVVSEADFAAAVAARDALAAPLLPLRPEPCADNWKVESALAAPGVRTAAEPSPADDAAGLPDVNLPDGDGDSPVNAGCGWSWRGGFGCGIGVG